MKPQQKQIFRLFIVLGVIVGIGIVIISLLFFLITTIFEAIAKPIKQIDDISITELFLTPNEYSRPQIPLTQINGIVVHYTANPGSDAIGNRNYFESLKDSQETSVSSHFIIGLDGTIVQCIPLDEIAYASNNRNEDTISIECCHPKPNGKFTKETYDSLVLLCAWLCGKYNLQKDTIIRHYDVTGKDCPRYYVAHEEKWEQFKTDVFEYIEENGK